MSEPLLRLVSTAILLPTGFFLIFFANETIFSLAAILIVALAYWEWLRLLYHESALWSIAFQLIVFILVVSFIIFGFSQIELVSLAGNVIFLLIFLAILALNVSGIYLFIKNKIIYWTHSKSITAINGFLIFTILAVSLVSLWNINLVWFCFILFNVWIMDIFAYMVGCKFGKTKIIPAISPGKSWQGLLGGLLGNLLVAIGFAYFLDYKNYILLCLAALAIGLVALLGDLFESTIKRTADAKQSSALIPGHGGFLDRIDGLIFTMPLALLFFLWQS